MTPDPGNRRAPGANDPGPNRRAPDANDPGPDGRGTDGSDTAPGRAPSFVLLVLAGAQFLMTLDSSVMNVSIRQVADDVHTTVTGIQSAITLYTLVMASFMITGGKLGSILGRRRAFSIGLVIYGLGSATTAAAPNLPVLLLGWSLLEGLGAALIMPAIVALVATNFSRDRRPAAYGLIAAAGAVAVAVGPLIGGAVTTFASWRWVFVGEVAIVLVLFVAVRRVQDTAGGERARLDLVGAILSILGLTLTVLGVLRSAEWGWVRPRPGGPALFGTSPVVWLVFGGLLVTAAFFGWEGRLERRGGEPLVRPAMLRNRQLAGGLTLFFFQFVVQSGVFFTIPLFLSVVLELSALQTGIRLLPLSAMLLLTAVGVPRFAPGASPRLVVRVGLLAMIAGILVLVGGLDVSAGAGIVAVPMALLGCGIGALASQLGAVTVSAVPDSQSAEVGGLQNTVTNFGASLGTALAGSVLIASLSASFVQGIEHNPAVPAEVASRATVELAGGVPFLSESDLRARLEETSLTPAAQDAVVAENESARIVGLRTALSVVALLAVAGLFATGLLPGRRRRDGGASPAGVSPDG